MMTVSCRQVCFKLIESSSYSQGNLYSTNLGVLKVELHSKHGSFSTGRSNKSRAWLHDCATAARDDCVHEYGSSGAVLISFGVSPNDTGGKKKDRAAASIDWRIADHAPPFGRLYLWQRFLKADPRIFFLAMTMTTNRGKQQSF